MKTIDIETLGNIKIGHASDYENGTGCTVIISPNGSPCGLDVRGGGPASRESELLKPTANADKIHAVLLSGGSAFGLDAAGGVMAYLEEHDMGLDMGFVKVPLVACSCIFDLGVANPKVRPDQKMGYAACQDAFEHTTLHWGNVGAGTGATIGKSLGPASTMKSGIGAYAVEIGECKVGAIAVVNALGDVYDEKTGKMIAGCLAEDKHTLIPSLDVWMNTVPQQAHQNTTLACILTNAKFDKTKCCKLAQMAQDGLSRTIKPVHTSMDGDSIYAMSIGEVEANLDLVGTWAADVLRNAILDAVKKADSAYGYTAYRDL